MPQVGQSGSPVFITECNKTVLYGFHGNDGENPWFPTSELTASDGRKYLGEVLQLVPSQKEWIQAYVAAGKNPSDEIMILTTEDIEEDPEHEYLELLQFLGLNPFEDNGSVASGLGETLTQASELDPMTPETRTMLKKFFKPYNKRLTDLLTSNGFEVHWTARCTSHRRRRTREMCTT